MKRRNALLAALIALSLCMMTGCSVDPDAQAQAQTNAIVECIRKAKLEKLASDSEAELSALLRARLEDAQAAKETSFNFTLPVTMVTNFEPDWDAVHQRLSPLESGKISAMRQSYEDALSDSLAAGEGVIEYGEFTLEFTVTKGSGNKWTAKEAQGFAELEPCREFLAQELSLKAAARPGPGADAANEKMGSRSSAQKILIRFLNSSPTLHTLAQAYPASFTMPDITPLLSLKDRSKMLVTVHFEVPLLDALSAEDIQEMLEPFLSSEYRYWGEAGLQAKIKEQVLERLSEGYLQQTRQVTSTEFLNYEGYSWFITLFDPEKESQDVQIGEETLTVETLDAELESQLADALERYYTTETYAAMCPWFAVEDLKQRYDVTEIDGVPVYTPASPQPGCVLLVTDSTNYYVQLETERKALEEAFGGQLTFVGNPDLAFAVLFYTQDHTQRDYTGPLNVYATTLRLQAHSLVGGTEGVIEISRTAEPPGVVSSQSFTYYATAPLVSELEDLAGFVEKLVAVAKPVTE